MNKVNIYHDDNCYYLVLDLANMTLYEKAKAINKFVKNDTKILENYVDNEIKAILRHYGINVNTYDKSVLKSMFDALKDKGIDIEINDLYKNDLYRCEKVGMSDNYMNVVIEDNRYLQCGVQVREIIVCN